MKSTPDNWRNSTKHNAKKGINMKQIKFCISILSAMAVMAVAAPALVAATPQAPSQDDKEKPGMLQPVQGKVTAVDQEKKTITVGEKAAEKTLHVSENTLITRKGEAIKLAALKVGEEVHAMTRITVDGTTQAVTIKVGPQTTSKE
jgi:ribosomal protein S1